MFEPDQQPWITLIADVIESKTHPDRTRLQRDVQDALTLANDWVRAVQPVHATVGDEFQGVYGNLADAALASMLLRLQLLSRDIPVDTRYGLGVGEYTVFSDTGPTVSQDGPGWWAARAAIEHVQQVEARTRSASPRTWITAWDSATNDSADSHETNIANAFFTTRDALVDRMTPRQCRLLIGAALGQTNTQLAAAEGISASAVSQTLRSSQAYALLDAHSVLLKGTSR